MKSNAAPSPTTKNTRMIRVVLHAIELLFSLAVIITAGIWIDAYPVNNVNFAMFVGVTSFLLCIFLVFVTLKQMNDRVVVLIQLGLLSLFWIFWLSAAAATSSTVAEVNSWPSYGNINCESEGYYYWDFTGVCEASNRKDAVRACTAFCWLTWALFTASLVLFLIDEGFLKSFSLKKRSAAAASPTTTTPPPEVSPLPGGAPGV